MVPDRLSHLPWRKTSLGKITRIFDGTHMTPKYTELGVPFYSVEHVTKNDFSETKFIAREVFESENKRVKLERGDILMTRIGDIGTARLIDWDVEASFYVSLALIKHSTDFDSAYLAHYIHSRDFRRELYKRTLHVAFPKKINLGDISDCQVALPALPEQQKIAAILSTWDRAIELTEKLVAAKQKRKQALMQQLFTGKVRLPGFEKSDWKNCHLGDVANNSTRRNGLPTDQPTVYSVTNSVGMIPMDEGVIGESIDRYKTVSRFDFAYNPMRINVGSIAMWEGSEDVLVSPDYVVYRCGSQLDAEFLNHFRKTHYWRHFVIRAGGGSVRVRIYFKDLASMKLKLPSMEEQRAIAAVLNTQDKEISLLNRRLDVLKQQKNGLMQQLLTGKVRVSVEECVKP